MDTRENRSADIWEKAKGVPAEIRPEWIALSEARHLVVALLKEKQAMMGKISAGVRGLAVEVEKIDLKLAKTKEKVVSLENAYGVAMWEYRLSLAPPELRTTAHQLLLDEQEELKVIQKAHSVTAQHFGLVLGQIQHLDKSLRTAIEAQDEPGARWISEILELTKTEERRIAALRQEGQEKSTAVVERYDAQIKGLTNETS